MGVGMPMPTRPQRHCDPASLVASKFSLLLLMSSWFYLYVSREILHPHISIFVKDAQQKHCVCDINNKLSVPSNFLVCACKKRILVLSIFHVFLCMNIKLMEEIFLFTHNLF